MHLEEDLGRRVVVGLEEEEGRDERVEAKGGDDLVGDLDGVVEWIREMVVQSQNSNVVRRCMAV